MGIYSNFQFWSKIKNGYFVISGMVLSISWPCLYEGRVFGLIGLDAQLGDIVESATYFTQDNSYAFVMDKLGETFYL